MNEFTPPLLFVIHDCPTISCKQLLKRISVVRRSILTGFDCWIVGHHNAIIKTILALKQGSDLSFGLLNAKPLLTSYVQPFSFWTKNKNPIPIYPITPTTPANVRYPTILNGLIDMQLFRWLRIPRHMRQRSVAQFDSDFRRTQ